MNNKNFLIKFIILFLLICGIFASCFRIDRPEYESNIKQPISQDNQLKEYPEPKTVTIKGRDYMQSQLPDGKFGGSFITSTIGEPKTLNPWVSKDATSSSVGALMFEPLFTIDVNTGEVIPALAKSIKISENQKEYIVELKHGLLWSDGKEITADDVVFTWNDIILAGFGNTSSRDSVILDGKPPKIEKINKYTVKFTTPEIFAPFLRLASDSIAPKHILQPIVKQGKQAFEAFWGTSAKPQDFVVSGPFKLKEYSPAQRIVLERNDKYYMINQSNQTLPYVDEYIIQIVGDLSNELLKFEAGELDIIGLRGKDTARMKEKEAKSDYTIYNIGSDTGTTFLMFNLNDRKNEKGEYYVPLMKQKWFNDKNFRTAVDYAIDRNSAVANILDGIGSPLFTAEAIECIFVNEKIKKGHERDINKSKKLLLESGFKYDNNGKLRDKDNNLVEFDLLTNAGNTEREAIGVLIKEDLTELGMKVNFKPIEFNTLIGKATDKKDWDAMIMGFTGNTFEPHLGKNVWNSMGPLHIFNLRDEDEKNPKLRSWEKEIDELFEKGAKETEFEKRKVFYDRYQEIAYDEKPFIYIFSPLRIIAIRNRVKNIYPTALGGGIHNPAEIYLEK